jgi:hypothetical protein
VRPARSGELGSFPLLDPDPDDVATPVGQKRQREIDGFAADRAVVADLDASASKNTTGYIG